MEARTIGFIGLGHTAVVRLIEEWARVQLRKREEKNL